MIVLFHFSSHYSSSIDLEHLFLVDKPVGFSLPNDQIDVVAVEEDKVKVRVFGYGPLTVPLYPMDKLPEEERILDGDPYAPLEEIYGAWPKYHAFLAMNLSRFKGNLLEFSAGEDYPFEGNGKSLLSFVSNSYLRYAVSSKEEALHAFDCISLLLESNKEEADMVFPNLLTFFDEKGKNLGITEFELYDVLFPVIFRDSKKEESLGSYDSLKDTFHSCLEYLLSLNKQEDTPSFFSYLKDLLWVKARYRNYPKILKESLRDATSEEDQPITLYHKVYRWILEGEYKQMKKEEKILFTALLIAKRNNELNKLKVRYTVREVYEGDYHEEREEVTHHRYDPSLCLDYYQRKLKEGDLIAVAMESRFEE